MNVLLQHTWSNIVVAFHWYLWIEAIFFALLGIRIWNVYRYDKRRGWQEPAPAFYSFSEVFEREDVLIND